MQQGRPLELGEVAEQELAGLGNGLLQALEAQLLRLLGGRHQPAPLVSRPACGVLLYLKGRWLHSHMHCRMVSHVGDIRCKVTCIALL